MDKTVVGYVYKYIYNIKSYTGVNLCFLTIKKKPITYIGG